MIRTKDWRKYNRLTNVCIVGLFATNTAFLLCITWDLS